MTPASAACIGLVGHYLNGLLDPFISLLEIHKLMVFMQEAGEPLRLRYKAAHDGPYAENLRHVLLQVDGHFVQGYGTGGDNPEKPLELLPNADEAASDGDIVQRVRAWSQRKSQFSEKQIRLAVKVLRDQGWI